MFPVINLGLFSIPAPAFILIIGYMVGSFLLDKKAASFSMDSEIIDRALWIGTISALIGARLSFIAGSPSAFKGNFLSVLSLNPALLDPSGGLVIGITAVILVVTRKKTDYWLFLDSLTPFLGALIPAYFLSRFASGNGYGFATTQPWGIYLWGAIRHPVQLYLAFTALLLLALILVYAPIKNPLPGSTFLLFSAATSSYLLFFSAFQVPGTNTLNGIRIDQILYWVILFVTLFLYNTLIKTTPDMVHHEIN